MNQTHLSIELYKLLQRRGQNWIWISTVTGISRAQVQKWKDSKTATVSEEHRNLLCGSQLCVNKIEQAELIAAIVKDQLFGLGSEWVHIVVSRSAPAVSPLAQMNLTPSKERNLLAVAKVMETNDGACEMIASMAKMAAEAKE